VYPRAAARAVPAPVLGITGPGGAGKSSLTDELVRRFVRDFPDKHVAIVAVDPTRKRTGGALLGDRIRLNVLQHPHVFMRSLATRDAGAEISTATADAVRVLQAAGYDLIVVETAGIGQGNAGITAVADVCLYAMTSEYGAQSQLEKIEMIGVADAIAVNKFERRGAEDALRDVRKQYRRERTLWDGPDDALPVFGTIAGQFADPGVSRLYVRLLDQIAAKTGVRWQSTLTAAALQGGGRPGIIPPKKERYLAEIAESVRVRRGERESQAELASRAYAAHLLLATFEGVTPRALEPFGADALASARAGGVDPAPLVLMQRHDDYLREVGPEALAELRELARLKVEYSQDELVYVVRDKEIRTPLVSHTLSHTKLKKVALPRYRDWGDQLRWLSQENVPGAFPFTAGVFPSSARPRDPTRMFAGEGPPERTNARFHSAVARAAGGAAVDGLRQRHALRRGPARAARHLRQGRRVGRVDRHRGGRRGPLRGLRPVAPSTSVSMTINGPAPIILAFFLNTAIRQQARRFRATSRVRLGDRRPPRVPRARRRAGARWEDVRALLSRRRVRRGAAQAPGSKVRGTVQADILKEDQAQNTCIFSTEFALKMMGDIQQYFIEQNVRNFYSVSISGYHIAEAGANPISQLAFTLANGFTYVEYYRARGMKVDDFAPQPVVLLQQRRRRRVRGDRPRGAPHLGRGHARALRRGRAQPEAEVPHPDLGPVAAREEIDFNDIRTTLQALYAIADNCNSLHTNAFDEAITTPTEHSVRRALAIQLIINRELGLTKNENPFQGSTSSSS
jgi:methylmalonyl-CoA mutase